MRLVDAIACLEARRADFARLHATVSAEDVLAEVLALLYRVAQPADCTTEAAAARLGVQARTVERWCRKGLFPNAFKTSEKGEWRIPPGDVEAIHTRRLRMVA